MKKRIKTITGLAALAALNPGILPASNHLSNDKQVVNVTSVNDYSVENIKATRKFNKPKLSKRGIETVYNEILNSSNKERMRAVELMRSDFATFVESHFELDDYRYRMHCLNTNWKRSENLKKAINDMAFALENKYRLGDVTMPGGTDVLPQGKTVKKVTATIDIVRQLFTLTFEF